MQWSEKITVTNEDNMELMKRYPDNYFDLAIVDPPYGIGADKAQNSAAEQRIKANGKSKAGRLHPTQKPVKLYEWLLMSYAKEGNKILDTHLGSGSIAIACYKLGFELTACELDKDYYDASYKRFKQVTSQTQLF